MLSEAKSRFAGKQKIFYISIAVILLSVLFVLYTPIKNSFFKIESVIDSTYSIGKIQQHYKKGKDSVITKSKTFHTKTKIAKPRKDSTSSYTSKDSLYSLSINIIPEKDSSFSLEYFLDITSKDLVRIDTVYQIRVDTLKIREVITKIIKPPFYNTFWFGAVAAAAVILLIIHFIN